MGFITIFQRHLKNIFFRTIEKNKSESNQTPTLEVEIDYLFDQWFLNCKDGSVLVRGLFH